MADPNATDGWELTVPEDGAQLLVELRRRGVRPGQRLHLSVLPGSETSEDAQRRRPLAGALRDQVGDEAIRRLEAALADNRRERIEALDPA